MTDDYQSATNVASDLGNHGKYDSNDEIEPENYFHWTISQNFNQKTDDSVDKTYNNYATDILHSLSQKSGYAEGTVIYYNKKADKGCIRRSKRVESYFFSSENIFSSDFVLNKSEKVLFHFDSEEKKPVKERFVRYVYCADLQRRILVGDITFLNLERGFGWIDINVFGNKKPFVFFSISNVMSPIKDLMKGKRVRFLISFEHDQPIANKVELINPKIFKHFTNKMSWDTAHIDSLADEVFSGEVIDVSKLIETEFAILPDNGAEVLYATQNQIYTRDRLLSIGERVYFLVSHPSSRNQRKFFARNVITEKVHSGRISRLDKRTMVGELKWGEAKWRKRGFRLTLGRYGKVLHDEIQLGTEVKFCFRLHQGEVQLSNASPVFSAPPLEADDVFEEKGENRSEAGDVEKGVVEKKSADDELLGLLQQKIANINLRAETVVQSELLKNSQKLYAVQGASSAVEWDGRGEMSFGGGPQMPFVIPMNQQLIGSMTVPNAPGYSWNPNFSPMTLQYSKTNPKAKEFIKHKGSVVYFSCGEGLISFVTETKQTESVFVYSKDVCSFDNELRAGEEVTFCVHSFSAKNALFVQPTTRKRASLKGVCVSFSWEQKEAAVQRVNSNWSPISFAVPDVLMEKMVVNCEVLFNVDIGEDFQPFVTYLRVLNK